jgi:5'-3' exonuclease
MRETFLCENPRQPVFKQAAVVDLSWAMYTFRHSYKDMCRVVLQGESQVMLPTGHVYGTLRVVQELAFQYRAVILAVDSPAPHRLEALPTYKSGRRQPTGDLFQDYKIMTDLLNILKIATAQSNVFYVKHEGLEADDLIASLLAASEGDSKEWSAYFNDNDILQARGRYHWFRSFHEPEVDRRAYLEGKYGVALDFLPIWYKVIRGDSSDRVPNVIPRFPSKKLAQLCMDLAWVTDLDQAMSYLSAMELSNSFRWVSEQAGSQESELYQGMKRNHTVVCPRLVPVEDLRFKRFDTSHEEAQSLLSYYEIRDLVPVAG